METVNLNYCIDKLKYKFCGLFPYLELNDNNEYEVFEARTSVDGCYNKIACSFKLPCGLVVNGETILSEDSIQTFQTLIYYYREYKNILDNDNEFIQFMNKGIGRIELVKEINIDKKWDLVPEEINLVECANLYDEMYKLKIKYEQDNNCESQCFREKYERMGGDVILNYYKKKIDESNEISKEYFTYVPENLTDYEPIFNIDLFFGNKIKDLGSTDTYVNQWSYDETYYKGDIVTYNGITYVCNVEKSKGNFEEGGCDENGFKINDFKKYIECLQNGRGEDVTIDGYCDSQLKSFRFYRDFIEGNNVVVPTDYEDWLFYYKKGYLAHYETLTDEVGNIDIIDGKTRNEDIGVTEKKLNAYGDVLYEIQRDNINRVLTFKYVIGGHLQAELLKITIDELNRKHYHYGDFTWDKDDKYAGVCYEEYYPYDENSDIHKMDEETFNSYITNYNLFTLEKAPFNIYSSKENQVVFINGIEIPIVFNRAYFTVKDKPYENRDLDAAPIIRPEYYEFISYPSKVKNYVSFSRGNAAAFERHLKLGEVKSLDDMENYANNGFFHILNNI